MKKSFGAMVLVSPTPVWVVGTYDDKGIPNIMTSSWCGICFLTPPCAAISLRENNYTYGNILKHKAFTINVPSETHVREVDYIGNTSGRDVDKFTETGLTPVPSKFVDAPYVKEFPLNVECRLIHTIKVKDQAQFIGEILDVKAEESVLSVDPDESVLDTGGIPDVEKVNPILYVPQIGTYHGIGRNLGRAHSIGKTIKGEQ